MSHRVTVHIDYCQDTYPPTSPTLPPPHETTQKGQSEESEEQDMLKIHNIMSGSLSSTAPISDSPNYYSPTSLCHSCWISLALTITPSPADMLWAVVTYVCRYVRMQVCILILLKVNHQPSTLPVVATPSGPSLVLKELERPSCQLVFPMS